MSKHWEYSNDVYGVLRAKWFLRNCTSVGKRVRLYGGTHPTIFTGGEVHIGDRVQLHSTLARLEIGAAPGGRLEIGTGCGINFGSSITATHSITLGEWVLIGQHVIIFDTAWHFLDPARRLERPPPEPVVIGDNAWIATRAMIMPGVTIGHDAAIAAGSVVTTDIPPRVFAAGMPAKVIRDL